ncbi:MAG: hypothetical protein AUK47_25285 [Deltaproteobacteria bacterium CG2_30_63_29]|nr:MAG: hypothetical protein AUK47_25285 [Deltaproteobacteria bacterium CG2_30_63_29]PIV99234.1 MAG: hypothetical protein COW42_11675 [Deltaproteobacteria bacterium CG17_big_fil_post_rev_8_21_14_2_50_63_7]PJB40278.1 MAG: hypothetical protein CO108_15200 [Deltaproteobacteria bacterium CG_4_9_14_3_um_filter_63_12]
MTLRFGENARLELRELLLKKGQEIATKLTDLLSGKKLDLTNIDRIADVTPGMRAEDRLRAYLSFLNDKRKLLDDDNDAYGRCSECNVDLGLTSLREMPWADRCQDCHG